MNATIPYNHRAATGLLACFAVGVIYTLIARDPSTKAATPSVVAQSTDTVYEIVYDGCEYIELGLGGGYTHKGNCTNSVHQQRN